MADYIPDFFLEQYALGELEGDRKEIIDNSPDLQEKILQIRESDEEIFRMYPPSDFSRSFRTYSAKQKRDNKILHFAVKARVPLIAAACLALFFATLPIMVNRSEGSVSSTKEITRIKGMKPTLHIYRDNNGEAELLEDREIVREYDRLQISYISAGTAYGAIFSIDGRGVVTLHYPETENSRPLLDSEGEIALPYSYELDDAPAYEKFFFVTSDSDFSVSELITAVQETPGDGGIPDNFDKTMVYLRKGE